MKYVRIQKIVKRVCDQNIDDIGTIKSIFNYIFEKQLYCGIVSEIDYRVSHYPKIRILEINDDEIKFRSFADKAMLVDKVKMSAIKELKLETEIEKKIDTEDDNRWVLLDMDDA